MALVVADRVQETSTTSGTGTLTLAGAVAGYQTFSSAIGNTNTTYYTIYDLTAYDWEVGIGTVGAGTLTRDTVLSNSAGTTAFISFSSNVKSVFCTYPAEKSINYDANGVATIGEVLGYSDTGIIGSFASTVAGYNQVIVQNKSSATNASANLNISNNVSTASSGFAELGINSSTFTGSGSFNIAGAAYLASAGLDLTVGTYNANNIHFVTNSSTTDAITVFNSGGVSLGGYGDPGIGTLYANNVYLGFTIITAAAGTTILTNASSAWQQVVGTTTQIIQLPDATTLFEGFAFTIANNSTGAVTVKDNASVTLDTAVTGGTAIMVLLDNSTVAGTWQAYSYLPASYDFSTTTANFGNATITNALWNGTTIATGYGGTGLTTFTAANNAIYSTSASALAAGTLPIQAGGTAATTFTANGVIYGNGTSALGVTAAGTTGQVLVGNTGAAPSWSSISGSLVSSFQTSLSGLTPSTATTGAVTLAGTLGATSGGTGLSAYTTGDIIYASATNTLSALADVATGNALISGGVGVAPSWGKIGLTTHVSGTLPTANGGTNLTSFTSGGALYATSTSALTTGTLPAASGGTSFSTYTTGDIIYASATDTLSKLTAGSNGQILTLASGVPSWAASTAATTRTTSTFTATAGQTTFTVSYTVNYIDVFRNGSKLAVTDYTATNGTSIVLNTGANVGDTVETVAYSALSLSTGVTSFSTGTTGLTPTSGTGAITLAGTLATANGGTNLTGFTSGGALYATSTSALTTGTLPVASGGTGVTTSTGTGSTVLSTSPTLVTPILGTPTSGTLTNCTGLPLTTGVTGTLPVANGGTGVTSSTGTGSTVLSASPTFTGTLGAATISATANISTSGGTVSDSKGDVRAAPINSQSGAYVLIASDAGKTISITTGGVTVNASIFSAGDLVSIFNNSTSNQTITQGTSVTLRLGGTATTGNRTLAQYGIMTLLCIVGGATPTFVCSGAGVT
jgi:hypothetical protein